MSPAAISVFVFGVYMAGQSALLMIAPNVLLSIVGLPPAQEVWVRVTGIALAVFGYYYIRAALQEIRPFFVLTTQGRALQFVLFAALVLTGVVPAILLLFAGVELASGIWTFFALRKS
jgi:hypothetical protein